MVGWLAAEALAAQAIWGGVASLAPNPASVLLQAALTARARAPP